MNNIIENPYVRYTCYALGTFVIAALFNRIIQYCRGESRPRAKNELNQDQYLLPYDKTLNERSRKYSSSSSSSDESVMTQEQQLGINRTNNSLSTTNTTIESNTNEKPEVKTPTKSFVTIKKRKLNKFVLPTLSESLDPKEISARQFIKALKKIMDKFKSNSYGYNTTQTIAQLSYLHKCFEFSPLIIEDYKTHKLDKKDTEKKSLQQKLEKIYNNAKSAEEALNQHKRSDDQVKSMIGAGIDYNLINFYSDLILNHKEFYTQIKELYEAGA